jgi:hypothetical protein
MSYIHSGLYIYNIDSRYVYFMCHVFIIFVRFVRLLYFMVYKLVVNYVLVFYIGTHLMMARESRNM